MRTWRAPTGVEDNVLGLLLAVAVQCPEPREYRFGHQDPKVVVRCVEVAGAIAFDMVLQNPAANRKAGGLTSVQWTFDGKATSVQSPSGWKADLYSGKRSTRVTWRAQDRKAAIRPGAKLTGFRILLTSGTGQIGCEYDIEFENNAEAGDCVS
jgi:hypothetical protein